MISRRKLNVTLASELTRTLTALGFIAYFIVGSMREGGIPPWTFARCAMVMVSVIAVEARLWELYGLLRGRPYAAPGKWWEAGYSRGVEHAGQGGTLVGVVLADEPPFVGPDGRPCVAALLADPFSWRGPVHNRWSNFWLDIGGRRVRVSVDAYDLRWAVTSSWRAEATKPRWFHLGAFAPELAREHHPDWICLHDGDVAIISSPRMRWRPAGDAAGADLDKASHAGSATSESSPYRASSRDTVVALGNPVGATDDIEAMRVTVINECTQVWERRSRLHWIVFGTAGYIGFTILFFAVSTPANAMNWSSRIPFLLGGAGLFVLQLGRWASNWRWIRARSLHAASPALWSPEPPNPDGVPTNGAVPGEGTTVGEPVSRLLNYATLAAAAFGVVAVTAESHGFGSAALLLLGIALLVFIYLVVTSRRPTEDLKSGSAGSPPAAEVTGEIRPTSATTAAGIGAPSESLAAHEPQDPPTR